MFSINKTLFLALLLLAGTLTVYGQAPPAAPATSPTTSDAPPPPAKVVVEPVVQDHQIEKRLKAIFDATEWFQETRVESKEGVVFLYGTAENDEYKRWAGNLVQSTEDVVAVVNKMQVSSPEIWNFKPALRGLGDLWRSFLHGLPFIGVGILILALSLFLARYFRNFSERILSKRVSVPLLRELIGRIGAILVVVFGLFLTMRVSGTTQLALTLLGGTGLLGLILGIAFKDITENFLASIFLSMQRPFQAGDLIEIVGVQGYVHRLTVRTTIMITLDGNYVQIPNATVYKSTIRNFTNNPNRRDEFAVYLSYGKSITAAQNAILKVLCDHPDVLQKPEPLVLVERLTVNTIDLRIYYWLDGIRKNPLAVKSSLIRLALHALGDLKLIVPGGPSEIVFPKEIPIRLMREHDQPLPQVKDAPVSVPSQPLHTDAEAQTTKEADVLKKQATEARDVESDVNLLDHAGQPQG